MKRTDSNMQSTTRQATQGFTPRLSFVDNRCECVCAQRCSLCPIMNRRPSYVARVSVDVLREMAVRRSSASPSVQSFAQLSNTSSVLSNQRRRSSEMSFASALSSRRSSVVSDSVGREDSSGLSNPLFLSARYALDNVFNDASQLPMTARRQSVAVWFDMSLPSSLMCQSTPVLIEKVV